MNNAGRIERIRELLTAAFAPSRLELEDESHKHAGHAGAQTGMGHFRLTIVSDAFAGKNALQCHRMIYGALGDMMQTDIHALSIRAMSTDQG